MESTVGQEIGVRELLEAGVHFGHQARRWNPKMKRYVFAERAGVHIIDLDQTVVLLEEARRFVRSVAEAGREVLFVGTKKQAQFTVAEQAIRSGQPYVVERYIGGMLTNFQTIQPRIEYFKALVATVEETPEEERSGKEWFARYREFQKLSRNFAGITEMERLPGAVFVVDPKKEELLVKEANRLKTPVVALTDTNCDPDMVDYVIPGNDDAIRSINLISRLIADAIIEGRGGEEVVPAPEEQLVPPVIAEAQEDEELATEPISEAAGKGGVSEDDPTGLADPVESAGEIRPEEDPTADYGATPDPDAESDVPDEPETGRAEEVAEVPEDVSEDVSEDVAEDEAEDVPEDVVEDILEDVAEDAPEGVAEETVVDESEGGESSPEEPAPVASGLPEGGTTQPTGGDEAEKDDDESEED